MKPWLIVLICIAVILAVIIIISKVKNKSKEINVADAYMSAPDDELVKLVEEAKREALEEREQRRNIPNEVNSEIADLQMLEDMLQEEFDGDDYDIPSPVIERKATMESFIKLENFEDKIIEASEIPQDVTAYISNSCTLTGRSFSDGAVSDTDITINGSDIRMGTSIDGKKTDMLILGEKMYIVNPNQNTYLELSDSFLKLMGQKKEDIRHDKIGVSAIFKDITPTVFSAKADGEEAICYEFKSEEKLIRIYTVESKFKAMLSGKDSNNLDSALKADSFSASPDMSKLSLDELNKAGMFAFFKDMMN